MGHLEDRVALVTGGGRGLGAAICRTLAEAGVAVAVGDIKEDLACSVADSIQALDRHAIPLPFDVGDEMQAESALRRTVKQFGKLDFVVNNAGVDVTCSIEELSVADFDRVLRTNLRGPFILSKLAFSLMKARKEGAIVNIVSTAAKRTWANACAYHSSKWGLLGLTHALHVEGRKENIKVSAVVCGGMKTPFLLDRFPDLDPDLLQDPRNVAEAVKFVLSQPLETVIPEIMVLPMRETSWP